MSQKKGSMKLFFYGLLLSLLLLGLVRILSGKKGLAFDLELLGLFFLLILSLIGLISYSKAWGERVLFFVFFFYICNLVLLWLQQGTFYYILMLVSLIGFFTAIPGKPDEDFLEGSFESNFDESSAVVFDQPVELKRAVKHSPGKYVASKRGKYYHEPKSEWAKKIKKENRVWFKNKEEAWEQGYKAHSEVD